MAAADEENRDGRNAGPSPDFDVGQSLRRVMQTMPTVAYVYDAQSHRVVFQNRSLRQMLGFAEDDRSNDALDWQANVHPDDVQAFRQHLERLRNQPAGAAQSCEVRLSDNSGAWRWFLFCDAVAALDPQGRPHLIAGSATEISRQKQSEKLAALTIGEMRHRTKNLSAIFDAIGRQSVKGESAVVQEFFERFIGRIRAILAAGSIVLASNERAADLRKIVEAALTPFLDQERGEIIEISGPDVAVSELTAGGISLAVHELATNALKYGALSLPGGKVKVQWSLGSHEGNTSKLTITWQETGGPPVQAAQREGFGSKVIRSAVRHESNGETRLTFDRGGLRCEFSFLLSQSGERS